METPFLPSFISSMLEPERHCSVAENWIEKRNHHHHHHRWREGRSSRSVGPHTHPVHSAPPCLVQQPVSLGLSWRGYRTLLWCRRRIGGIPNAPYLPTKNNQTLQLWARSVRIDPFINMIGLIPSSIGRWHADLASAAPEVQVPRASWRASNFVASVEWPPRRPGRTPTGCHSLVVVVGIIIGLSFGTGITPVGDRNHTPCLTRTFGLE